MRGLDAMKIGILKESAPGERRVAVVPRDVAPLIEAGHPVRVESGAGARAFIDDAVYREAGAEVVDGPAAVFEWAEVFPRVNAPAIDEAAGVDEVAPMPSGAVCASFFLPNQTPETLRRIAGAGITLFSMNRIPRISRAQSMDALSSQATIAGYKAALIGADLHSRFFPMLMTAAGTIPPAKVLVLGAGVAGLQAIATAMRLGAVVEAFDIRPEAKEEVESLGAKFIDVHAGVEGAAQESGYAREVTEEERRREQEVLAERFRDTEVVITTALVPGRPAPRLVTGEMVRSMRTGTVIVDLAAEAGGNCELTEPGKTIAAGGVTIAGPLNLPATMPFHASRMYSKNITTFLRHVLPAGPEGIDLEDEIAGASCLAHEGKVRGDG